MNRQTFKGISNRGRRLLAQQEGETLDFKAHPDGLHAEDLVAFANSEQGGAILIGISETVTEDGLQGTEVTGCEIGDDAKLAILNRASACIPAVPVEIYFENTGETPFIRIEIPGSHRRPHCTASGTYKIRVDGRNQALTPGELLAIFMDREGEKFFHRFATVTEDLKTAVDDLRQSLKDGGSC